MDIRVSPRADDVGDLGRTFNESRPKSAASWGAITAGALVAIALSLLLLTLGAGLGFAAISPWPDRGLGLGAFTVTAAIWLIVTQWVSALFGGYITGRLRTRWIGTHEHEIFFRDTANGLVTWALATVVVAVLLTSSLSSGIGGGAKMISGVAASGAQGLAAGAGAGAGASANAESSSPALAYGLDKLFRPNGAGTGTGGALAGAGGASLGLGAGTGTPDPRVEAIHILANDLTSGSVPDADRAYLASLVSSRTGLSDADAQRRVSELIDDANAAAARVKAAADQARKDAAEFAIYTALSMLIGAFIASAAAALGGRLRDEHL